MKPKRFGAESSVNSRDCKGGNGRGNQTSGYTNTKRGPPLSSDYNASDKYGDKISSNEARAPLPPNNDKSYKGNNLKRNDIGPLLEDRIEFLNSLPSKWNSEQTYYELTGPNKKNWETITTTGLQSDISGKLLRALLHFLALPDISSHKKAAELFACLNNNVGQVALMRYFQMGPLAADTIKTAVDHGRGGNKWTAAMKDAQNICEVIYNLMSLFIDCQMNPMLPIEQLSSRIKVLLGELYNDETPSLSGWHSGVCNEDKQTHINSAIFLYSRLSSIERIKQSAIDSAKEMALAKEEEEKQSAEEKRQSKQRSRDGIRFLDDPKRDRDYLNIHVVPLAGELLSAPPVALPKNLVLSLGKSRGEAAEIENDFVAPLSSPITTSTTTSNTSTTTTITNTTTTTIDNPTTPATTTTTTPTTTYNTTPTTTSIDTPITTTTTDTTDTTTTPTTTTTTTPTTTNTTTPTTTSIDTPITTTTPTATTDTDTLTTTTTPGTTTTIVPPSTLKFRSIHHYLNTHFQLNREDCLAQLRRGLAKFREHLMINIRSENGNKSSSKSSKELNLNLDQYFSNSQSSRSLVIDRPSVSVLRKVANTIANSRENDRVYVYENVCVRSVDQVREGIGYAVSFDAFGVHKNIDWSRSSRFMNGSLLCLSPDGTFNERNLVVATVLKGVQPPESGSGRGWRPTVLINIDSQSVGRFDPIVSYVMIESMVFFEAYRPVLRALQKLGEDGDIPFADHLLGNSTRVLAPEYLFSASASTPNFTPKKRVFSLWEDAFNEPPPVSDASSGWDMSAVFPAFKKINRTKYWDPLKSPALPPLPSTPELDESQKNAIKLALTRRLAIIQGPPGTGKTFVGVLISKILLANKHLRSNSPILFICQTNHALDQMLEHVYAFNKNIIRVGGRSESPIMQNLSIRNVRQKIIDRNNSIKYDDRGNSIDQGKYLRLPRRGSDEYEARDRMQMCLAGLRAAFAQRGVVVSEGEPFSNCHLARLQDILESLHVGFGKMIDALVNNCDDTVKNKMWTTCTSEYKRRNHVTAKTTFLPDWTQDYKNWNILPMKTKLLLLATYDSDTSDDGGSGHDDVTAVWLHYAPVKRKKVDQRRNDRDDGRGSVTTNSKHRYGKEEDDRHNHTNILNHNKVLNRSPGVRDKDRDRDIEDCESVLSGDTPDRNLDDDDNNAFMDDDGEYAFDFSGGSRNNREENMVENLINRPVNLDQTVRERVLASLKTLRAPRYLYGSEIWNTIKSERGLLLKYWTELLNYDAAADVKEFTNDFLKAAKVEAGYNASVDSAVLRSADVIGMTTNGAAKYNELLRALKPEVIVVEEAAEVLEASVVAAFTKATKHLILIGDHLQLRPQVSEYGIATHNGLEVSLFERLVRMGVPHVTLTTQRRMHPEISALIQPSIYRHLLNAPSVSLYPPVNGITNRLYFISHTEPEDGQTTAWGAPENEDSKDTKNKKSTVRPIDMAGVEMSKTNSFEAKYLIRLLAYLLLNGYQASQVVVLSMYKGQMMLLKRLAREHAQKPSSMLMSIETVDKVRMTTTDNYQGEESDIVLLSLVRSNEAGKGGFVTVMNRICVALSRAKHGMYVIGNFTMMQSRSNLWEGICRDMEGRGRIGKALVLQCHAHPATRVEAVSDSDFDRCPHGGCMLRCDAVKPCGHICKLLCHLTDHSLIICKDACERPLPPGCTHPCRKLCGQTCGPCMNDVSKLREFCGHSITVKCSENVENVVCTATCGVSMVCGHSCPDKCHPKGHDVFWHKCHVRCPRTRSTCSHACPKLCHQDCGPCLVTVTRELSCGHLVSVACSVDVTTIACTSRCSLKLSCGHQCSQICGLPCDELCKTQVPKTLPLCRFTPRHWKEVACSEDVTNTSCELPCGITLTCGHRCAGTCATCTLVDGGETSPHVPCTQPCQKRLACNHLCNGNHPCSGTSCPPCSQPCGISCGHGPCDLPCGVPCTPCPLPCQYTCLHLKCQSLCHEIHTLIPAPSSNHIYKINNGGGMEDSCTHNIDQISEICQQFCTRRLSPCHHECRGICGETCPRLCLHCNPAEIEDRLFRLPTVVDVKKLPISKFRFLALACGHAFEVRALDLYMSKYKGSGISSSVSSVEVPACPECGVKVQGPYRYRELLHTALQRLVPEHQERIQKQLMQEIYEDLTTNNAAGAVVERLHTMITANTQHGRYSKLTPLLHLLLGQANMMLGGFNVGSRDNLLKARDGATDLAVKREALVCLGLCYLRGLDASDKIALTKIPEANLEKAKTALSDAIKLGCEHHDLMTINKRTDEQLASLVSLIQHAIDSKREEAEAQRLAKEMKLKEMALAKAAADAAAAAARDTPTPISASGSVSDPVSASSPDAKTDTAASSSSCFSLSTNPSRGGSALHMAACRGDLTLVKDLVKDGADVCQRDDLGNTPLLCAAENACKDVLLFLAPLSPWHTTNHSRAAFLDIVLDVAGPIRPLLGEAAEEIEDVARRKLLASQDGAAPPSHEWAALKYFQACRCSALDELMDMTGLRKVKAQALDLFYNVTEDMKRPVAARMSAKQSMNFIFLGNPGTGKTTVARLLGKILEELGLRVAGKFVETSGQRLLQDGSSKFPPVLQSATPGVLFIDEVYQLDPKGSSDGKAITNMIMQAAEEDRDKLTVIVAGYADDVREKWVASNSGISSRFPFEITFEDFSEKELYTILMGVIRRCGWVLDRYTPADGTHPSVNAGLVVARRLARGADKKGFANARSVRVLVEDAMRVASKRQKAESQNAVAFRRALPPQHSVTLTLPDFLGSPIDPSSSPLVVELMSKTGLDDVKRAVLGLLQLAKENYISELKGEGVLDICLNRMFLGNPGTGKTTIAKLYGRILKEMGFLTNGEVVLKGASQLVGDVVGSTAKKVNELIDCCKGKVLVVDEAYVLARANSLYGREALDTLVERVQGTPGEDIAVILCGYEDEMKTMLRDGNPGLSRRFRVEDAFYFADYDDSQLTAIMVQRATESYLHVTEDLAKQAVVNVLAKQRAKPNFGNVGAVNNLLEHGKERMMKRLDKSKVNGRWVLTPEDLFEAPPPDAAMMSMRRLVNADHITDHIQQLQKRVKVQLNKGTDPKKLLKNYVFIGPPGTGKTTVARAFGEVFHGLGLLSTSEVVECKAMELIAGYVGQTSGLMRDKMNEARGGVLFIDEAYGLDPSRSVFAKDAIETLLANMTDPKYEGNMVIILAGYKEEIEQLLRSNPGLHRRVTERIEFHSWSPAQCLTLLLKLIEEDALDLPTSLHGVAKDGFAALARREGWGNAGDVSTVYGKMRGSRENRCDEDGNTEGGYTLDDVTYAFATLLEQRPEILVEASGMGQREAAATANDFDCGSSQSPLIRQNETQPTVNSTAVYKKDEEEVEQEWVVDMEEDPSDEELWSSLDEALQALDYDLYKTRDILNSQELPVELVAYVSNKLNRKPDKVKLMLVRQCPVLLPRVEELIVSIEKELMKQREVRERIERADAAEKERLQREEKERQRAAVLERVKQIGRCPAGFEWKKVEGGYRCGGGSHFVTYRQLEVE